MKCATHRQRDANIPDGAVLLSGSRWGAGFTAISRFIAEIEAAAAGTGKLRPGYVLAGDEIFLLDRCRAAVFKAFVPPDLRDFCLSDLDLATLRSLKCSIARKLRR